jgi:RNA-directed DNA polymerase
MNVIKKIIKEEGFFINEKKVGYFHKGQKQYVTGLSVNGGVRVPRKLKRKIRQVLFYCEKYGVQNHLNKIGSNKKHFKEWLAGNIAFIQSIEPKVGKEFWGKFNKIDWYL